MSVGHSPGSNILKPLPPPFDQRVSLLPHLHHSRPRRLPVSSIATIVAVPMQMHTSERPCLPADINRLKTVSIADGVGALIVIEVQAWSRNVVEDFWTVADSLRREGKPGTRRVDWWNV
jgi:hypothetical protein